MTPTGIEPVLPPWKGDVLTAWPRSRIYRSLASTLNIDSSPSWTRTNDIMINSHALYQLSYWGLFYTVCNHSLQWKLREQTLLKCTFSLKKHWSSYLLSILCTLKTEHTLYLISYQFLSLSGQALDLLVTIRWMHYCTYTLALSTLSSSRGLTNWDISSWGGLHA